MALKFDQSGLSAGVSGYSRTDGLATGSVVTVTRNSSDAGSARLVMVPPGDTTAFASWHQTTSTTWTFTPTVGVYGTYRVEEITLPGTTRETRQSRIFGVRLPRSSLLIPTLNERADLRANMVDVSTAITDASDNNASDFLLNTDLSSLRYGGWWRTLVELYRVVENSSYLRPARAVLLENPGAYGVSTLTVPTAEQCDGVSIVQGDRVVSLVPILLNGVYYSVFRHAGAYMAADIPESRMQVDGTKMDVMAGYTYAGRTLRYSTARQSISGSPHWWYPDGAPMYHITKRLNPSGGSDAWVNLLSVQMSPSNNALHTVTIRAVARYAPWIYPRSYIAQATYIGDGVTDVLLVGEPPSLADPGETDLAARLVVAKSVGGIMVNALRDRDAGSGGILSDYSIDVDVATVRMS